MRRNRLNNMNMRNLRNKPEYQAVITDLALIGVIDIDVANNLLGYKIPDEIKKPDWWEYEKVTDESNDY